MTKNKKKREKKASVSKEKNSGKLRIGDNWNAITIIALSQQNPLKAVAEFIENSIDAQAGNIIIIRGKEKKADYLRISDDGNGIPRNENGIPDFKYVATHICDSIKKRLKKEDIESTRGIQGEFGIGLLSFWTIGEQLTMTSSGDDHRTYQMIMTRKKPGYTIVKKGTLFSKKGTELIIHPLLSGVKQITGEKMQNYLASELRDRIRKNNIRIKIIDRKSRKEYNVEPRKYSGRLLHDLPPIKTGKGDIYTEIYLNEPGPDNVIGIYRSGTRVLQNITELDQFNTEPWTFGYLQGIIDVPFLHLTPGTRSGIIHDHNFHVFCECMKPLAKKISGLIEEQKKAEEEKASRNILKSIQNAIKEAFLMLPREEYNWLDVYAKNGKSGKHPDPDSTVMDDTTVIDLSGEDTPEKPVQKQFFEYSGPLYKVIISPSSSVVRVKTSKNFRTVSRDKNKRIVETDLDIHWKIKQGNGKLENINGEIAEFHAPVEPGLTILEVTVKQKKVICIAESIITVTESLIPKEKQNEISVKKGLPGYTYHHAAGELWRSRYDRNKNIITINNGHKDFVFASKNKSRKLRYICRLFAKELIIDNFPHMKVDDLIERMIELSLYTEENLR